MSGPAANWEGFLDGLNEAQRQAVTCPANILQVLAPPGSGKTKTLTCRVAWLLNHQKYKPWNIIVATFTVKAAREMKERIGQLIGNGLESKLVLGTFHSICFRYLCRYGHLIGLKKGFGVADSKDSQNIIKRIVKAYGSNLNIDPAAARNRISSAKAKGKSVDDLAAELRTNKSFSAQNIVVVYREYEQALATSNLLDYDDLLVRCVELLRKHPACVSNVESVLVDEFQDTNVIQYDLMSLFAQSKHRITIVGDPDQSIYSFRSAEIRNLERMTERYRDTQVINLENNYRSSGAILLAAVEVIQQDQARANRPLLATHAVGTKPTMRVLRTAGEEAGWIVREIQRVRALFGSTIRLNDVAILIRSAFLSRLIETELAMVGLPYRMVGGSRFFDRVEIKLVLDYLSVINHPENNDALSRIINVPSRQIGEKSVKTIIEVAEANKISAWKLLCDCKEGRNLNLLDKVKAAKKKITKFVNLIEDCQTQLSLLGESVSLVELMEFVINQIELNKFLEKHYSTDHESRVANVTELLQQAREFSENLDSDDDALPKVAGVEQEDSTSSEILSRYLATLALSSDVKLQDEDEPADQVTISTIHGSKGLEWPVVFIPAVYEGSIPHSRAENIDEERRLLYVAMTRAKALLSLSMPANDSRDYPTSPSHFLEEQSVKRLLDKRGPTLGYSDIQCVSRIIGRQCPPPPNASKILELIPSLEDDDSRRHIKSTNFAYRGQKGAIAGVSSNNYMATSAMMSTGFVTATSQLQSLQSQALTTLDGNRKRAASPHKEAAERSRQTTKLSFDKSKIKGAIGSFFKANNQPSPRADAIECVDLTDSPRPVQIPSQPGLSHRSLSHASASPREWHAPVSRPPIPRELSDHRPVSIPNPKRSYITSAAIKCTAEEALASNPSNYFFLSSPPEAAAAAAAITVEPSPMSAPLRPTPSVPATKATRTLGMRRNIDDGWKSRGSAGSISSSKR